MLIAIIWCKYWYKITSIILFILIKNESTNVFSNTLTFADSYTGWGTVIRTQECRSQSQNILFSKVFYFVLKCLVFSTSQPFLFAISFFIFLNYSKMMDKFWTSKHHPLIMLFTILILHLLYTFSNVFANNFTTILSFQFNSSITSSFTTFILPLLSNMVYKYNQVHPLWWKCNIF